MYIYPESACSFQITRAAPVEVCLHLSWVAEVLPEATLALHPGGRRVLSQVHHDETVPDGILGFRALHTGRKERLKQL